MFVCTAVWKISLILACGSTRSVISMIVKYLRHHRQNELNSDTLKQRVSKTLGTLVAKPDEVNFCSFPSTQKDVIVEMSP